MWTGDKIEIKITCTFQYFLKKNFLPDLHEAYNVDYQPVVKGTAIDAIKGRAADLPIDDYIRFVSEKRETFMSNLAVSNDLFKQIIVATVNFYIQLNQNRWLW